MRRNVRENGFTLIELMIAMTVLLIGISGILSMQLTSLQANAYSRHATEAAVLAEDQMEALRTIPVASIVDGDENVTGSGKDAVDEAFSYTRAWTVSISGSTATLEVAVSWLERGSEAHSIVLRTQRPI